MKEKLLQLFEYSHLPAELQEISRPFCETAHMMCDLIPPNPERTVMLRHLRIAKDHAVTAKLWQDDPA